MGLFSRFKKNTNSSASDTSASTHHHREAANPLEEVAEADETLSPDGSLSTRMAWGVPTVGITAQPESNDVERIRAAADPEDDGAQEDLIRREREEQERGL